VSHRYRIYRNCEQSLVDYITTELPNSDWQDIRVLKAFTEAYEGKLPAIVISFEDSDIIRTEIGSDSYYENLTVYFRLFCKNDGQRLDLVAWLISKLIVGIDYYEEIVGEGEITSKTLTGRITINKFTTNRKELANTENLVKQDRCRHLLGCVVRVSIKLGE